VTALDGHAVRQVSWFIRIESSDEGELVAKHLRRRRHHERGGITHISDREMDIEYGVCLR